jgi:hypothetical protein
MNINSCVMSRIHIPVMCFINHLIRRVSNLKRHQHIRRATAMCIAFITGKWAFPPVILYTEEFEDTINMYVVGSSHVSVMSVINHCWKLQLVIGGRINIPVIPVLRPQHENKCSLLCHSGHTEL